MQDPKISLLLGKVAPTVDEFAITESAVIRLIGVYLICAMRNVSQIVGNFFRQSVPGAGESLAAAKLIDDSIGRATFEILPSRGPVVQLFEMSSDQIEEIFSDPLYQALVATDAFQRLKGIRFLGAIDYLLHPNGKLTSTRHTRFQHSLCVGRLALHYCQRRRLPRDIEHLIVSAALLHDIGHSPLSHSVEAAYMEVLGIGHHIAGEMIVRGSAPIGKTIPHILALHGLSPNEVLKLIANERDTEFHGIFGGPINVDTVEAICRSYTYLSTEALAPSPVAIMNALMDVGADEPALTTELLDSFWELKDLVYGKLIQSELSIAADFVASEYVRGKKHRFSKRSFFDSEQQLFAAHPDLRLRIVSLLHPQKNRDRLRPVTIPYKKRSFMVNRLVDLTEVRDLQERYTQSKESKTVTVMLQ